MNAGMETIRSRKLYELVFSEYVGYKRDTAIHARVMTVLRTTVTWRVLL
jgi:hypothetical protein